MAVRRAARDRAVRSALFSFALTRLVVLAVLVLGGQINRVTEGSGEATRELRLSLGKMPVARVLRATVMQADVNWYRDIAQGGYEQTPFAADRPHNWAFFPLFPLAWRLAARVTGEYALTGMLLAHVFFFFALVLLYKTARAFGLGDGDADRAVFYLAAFPTGYFFSLPLTEPLFLLLTVGSFYAAKRERWWLAGLLGAVASATRVTGVLLAPALVALHLQTYGRGWRRWSLLAPLVVPAGLVSFMCYLYAVTGNALAFSDILVTWGRGTGLFVAPLLGYVSDPLLVAVPWDFRLLNFAAAVLALACGVALLVRREWALGLYTLSSIVLSLSSGLLQSQARYAMVLFPVFMVLAVAGRRRRLDEALRAVWLVLLALLTALFAAHFTAAMA